ncbi:MAG: ECF transporter S component [Anaerolineae bacterium]|nr:ECF transporter S component [Thermoflexales bacterium]MDW8407026.1 ECF transporter S component [Anaerolineae bacterium]
MQLNSVDQPVLKQTTRPRWSTRELLTAAVLAMAFAALLVPFTYLYAAVLSLGILARSALTGLFFMPAAFAAYTLRKPGAVIFVSLVSGLAAIPFTPYGLLVLGIGALTGAIGEAACWLVTRYRHFSLWRVVLMSFATGLVEFLLVLFSLRVSQIEPPMLVAAIVLSVIGFVVVGIVARFLADAVARTGALNNTALGREREKRV